MTNRANLSRHPPCPLLLLFVLFNCPTNAEQHPLKGSDGVTGMTQSLLYRPKQSVRGMF